MEMLREAVPFRVGMIVPPIVMLALRATWSGLRKFGVTFGTALVLGFCTSLLAGELVGGIPDGLMAVIIDTSLVYTGSQLAYRIFWKPVLQEVVKDGNVAIIRHEPPAEAGGLSLYSAATLPPRR